VVVVAAAGPGIVFVLEGGRRGGARVRAPPARHVADPQPRLPDGQRGQLLGARRAGPRGSRALTRRGPLGGSGGGAGPDLSARGAVEAAQRGAGRLRLWRETRFQAEAEAFWRQLARRLRGHPALVAYNPLNEPHPERAFGLGEPADEGFGRWRTEVKGTPADLGGRRPLRLPLLRSLGVHDLQSEPGPLRLSRAPAGSRRPDDPLERRLVARAGRSRRQLGRRARHPRPSHRGLGVRRGPAGRRGPALPRGPRGRVLKEGGWHWDFYAFRGDGEWTGLDYEMGVEPVDPRIWGTESRGEDPERYKRRHDNPLWDVLRRELAPCPLEAPPPPEPGRR